MMQTPLSLEDMTLNIEQQVHVRATLEATFDALLEEVGPANTTPDGRDMPLKLEPWPGGRWYRDLGDGNGHLWAHVQAIKRPTLLEFTGPLFASFPFSSNVQYRLTESSEGTLITFRHTAFGFIQPDHKANAKTGWAWILERTRRNAEAGE
jgi:hypothetical protein